MELSLLLLTCISALIGAAYIPKDIRKKPGKCPYVQDIANRKCPLPPNVQDMVAFNNFLMSIAECLFDGDCKGNDKCCFDGCKTKCTRVMKWDRDEIHAGKCPPVDTSHRRGCKYVDDSMMQNKCIRDKDCQRNEKCCFDGCRVNCVQVSKFPKMKPGQCPPKIAPAEQKCKGASTVGDVSPTEVTQGVNYCRSDDDCNGTSKCCDDGCHRKCSPPMFLKESDIKTKSETRKRVDKLLDEHKTTAQRTEMTLEAQQGEILQAGETLAEMPIKSAGKEPKFKLKEERTFVMIKPDAVRRGLISEITSRFEKKGYKLVAMKLVQPTQNLLRKHYSNLRSKSLIDDIIEYVGSGPVVAMAWQGIGAVDGTKRALGNSELLTAMPGTIRFDFSSQASRDIVHGSENIEQADKEIRLWFSEKEICDWDPL